MYTLSNDNSFAKANAGRHLGFSRIIFESFISKSKLSVYRKMKALVIMGFEENAVFTKFVLSAHNTTRRQPQNKRVVNVISTLGKKHGFHQIYTK